MENKLLNTAESQNKLTFEKPLSKAQIRRKRYEDSTMNRPITLRAHPNLHESIKSYAKTGCCNNCQKLRKKGMALRLKLEHQVSGPVKWSDKFTTRDAILTSFTALFIAITFIFYYLVTQFNI